MLSKKKLSKNFLFNSTNNEDQARQAAWRNVGLKYKKVGDKYVRKSQGEFEESMKELDFDEMLKLKKAEMLGKQSKLLDKLIKQGESDNENI